MHIIISLGRNVTNELVAGWCIIERVKRLAGNEIELGMNISTIESRASNIPMVKGNYVCCHYGSIDKDLRRICRSQYGHPGSAIGYWPERCRGHVYIVLEPVGTAHLMFDVDLVQYELCGLVTECCSESRMWSQTWRGAPEWSGGKDWYIGRWYSDTGRVSKCTVVATRPQTVKSLCLSVNPGSVLLTHTVLEDL